MATSLLTIEPRTSGPRRSSDTIFCIPGGLPRWAAAESQAQQSGYCRQPSGARICAPSSRSLPASSLMSPRVSRAGTRMPKSYSGADVMPVATIGSREISAMRDRAGVKDLQRGKLARRTGSNLETARYYETSIFYPSPRRPSVPCLQSRRLTRRLRPCVPGGSARTSMIRQVATFPLSHSLIIRVSSVRSPSSRRIRLSTASS